MQEFASDATLLSVSVISTLCPRSCFLFVYLYVFIVILLIIDQLINRFFFVLFFFFLTHAPDLIVKVQDKHCIMSLKVRGLRNRVAKR